MRAWTAEHIGARGRGAMPGFSDRTDLRSNRSRSTSASRFGASATEDDYKNDHDGGNGDKSRRRPRRRARPRIQRQKPTTTTITKTTTKTSTVTSTKTTTSTKTSTSTSPANHSRWHVVFDELRVTIGELPANHAHPSEGGCPPPERVGVDPQTVWRTLNLAATFQSRRGLHDHSEPDFSIFECLPRYFSARGGVIFPVGTFNFRPDRRPKRARHLHTEGSPPSFACSPCPI